MKTAVIESPYAGRHGAYCVCADCADDVEVNVNYLRHAMNHALVKLDLAPFASHGLYTQDGVLRDGIPAERDLGIKAGLAWGDKADVRLVFADRGISKGMSLGIDRARSLKQPIRLIRLGAPWSVLLPCDEELP